MLMMFLQKKLFKADTHASHAWHTRNKGRLPENIGSLVYDSAPFVST